MFSLNRDGRERIVACALAALVACQAAAAEPDLSQPLPGQIVIDPDHPQWLKRHGGDPLFMCGPGDPEEFLYRGRRNADGTRNGDQERLIDKLIEHGGNCIYLQAVRSGGDGPRDHNPFVDGDPNRGVDERILDQWERWFTRMDDHGIVIYFFLYDDGVRPWGTKRQSDVPDEERQFVEALVRRFRHHKNLIWIIAEESEEALSGERVRALAEIIRLNDHAGRVIGDHHQSSTTFKNWRPRSALNHFAMQYTAAGQQAHQGAIEALGKAAGRYQVIYAESTAAEPDAKHAWGVAMGGLMPMMLKMDIAGTPPTTLLQCRALQRFFEASDFTSLSPHDELAAAKTQWVLADPGRSYIAYSEDLTGAMGVQGLAPGAYEVRWLDCATGKMHHEVTRIEQGQSTFARPPAIGNWCAASLRRVSAGNEATAPARSDSPASTAKRGAAADAFQTSDYFPPPESAGGWRKIDASQIESSAGMNSTKLAELRQWLLDSDKRPFAAVVIRQGSIVLEVERGNSAKTDARRVASVSKAVCATVLAIASQQSQQGKTPRRMRFDDLAFDFIPQARPLSDPRKAAITVKQLLNHTSGITPESTGARNVGPWRHVLGHDGDPLTAKLAFDPGTKCGYSTFALYHASLVCENVTGKPYDQFAIEALFKPIGVERWTFEHFDGGGPDGDRRYGRHPSHSLGMPARDLARIAYCLLRGGRWQDKQVIPSWFVDETAAPTHSVEEPELRFQRDAQSFSHGWELPARLTDGRGRGIPADARFKPGSGGQLMAFVPSLDLVITRQTGGSGPWEYEEYLRRACAAVLQKPRDKP
jgi:CubicO group peptidase (beta-lactamase class C family)